MTQPAITNHVKLLEKEYGIKIFIRNNKELKATPEGEILIKYARRMMSIDNNAKQAIEDGKRQLKHLSIGITQTAGENLMPQVIAMYCDEHPNIRINICTDTIKNLYNKMKSYEIDLAVVEGIFPGGDFKTVLLDTDYLCLIVSPHHRFAKRQSVYLQELKEEKMILRSKTAGTRMLFDNYLLSNSESIRNFNVVMELDNVTMIKDLVAMNMGVSIIAHSACKEELQQGKLVIVPVENAKMTREINLVYQKDFSHTEILEDLRAIYAKIY